MFSGLLECLYLQIQYRSLILYHLKFRVISRAMVLDSKKKVDIDLSWREQAELINQKSWHDSREATLRSTSSYTQVDIHTTIVS